MVDKFRHSPNLIALEYPSPIALALIHERLRVFPINANKIPLTPHGINDATLEVAKVEEFWTHNPGANIAVAIPEGYFVLDIDPRHNGDLSMQIL